MLEWLTLAWVLTEAAVAIWDDAFDVLAIDRNRSDTKRFPDGVASGSASPRQRLQL